ncbi:hypothetical protein [uncultured Clostridium sp.]|jgi:hypothetical protein|nr:hypothetical protein [uncultured Clostridium sp.]
MILGVKENSNLDIINENVEKTIVKTLDSKSKDIEDIVIERFIS